MKKFIACVLLVLMLAQSGLSEVENFDVSSLSDSDLESALNDIQEEMVSRGIVRELEEGEYVLYAGSYVVGKDIAPGRYTVSPIGGLTYEIVIEEYEGARSEYSSLYDEYSLEMTRYEAGVLDEKPTPPNRDDYYFRDSLINDPMTIELRDGQVLYADGYYYHDYQKLAIKKSTGLFMDE